MKYYLDQEFIEGFRKPIKWLPTIGKFNKSNHLIDLISIGIVGDDGSEFYAISNEYSYDNASEWVKQNVILPLYKETVHGDQRNKYDVYNFHLHYGRSNKCIMVDLLLYIYRHDYSKWLDSTEEFIDRAIRFGWNHPGPISFYGYYADYDWVLFCSLFGTMMDLPEMFPMYCIDLKQILDEKISLDNGFTLDLVKRHVDYPTQDNEHNALADARWNKKLHEFIQTL